MKQPLLIALLGANTTAAAHSGENITAIDVVVLPGDARIDVELSVGLVYLDDGPRWLCHELLTAEGAVQSPRFARGRRGGWASYQRDPDQARDGVASWFSPDGCDWSPASGLGGRGVLELAFDPMRPEHALAVVRDATEQTALMMSSDSGATWAPVDALAGAMAVHGVRFGADGTAWVGATTDQTRVWLGAPDGSWTATEVPGAGQERVQVWAVGEPDVRTALAAVDPDGLDTLLVTTDGLTWSAVEGVEGEVVDAAPDGEGSFWVILDGDRLHHVGAGTELRSWGVGVGRAAGETWYAPHAESTGWMVQRIEQGSLVGAWAPAQITRPACAENAAVTAVCGPLWTDLSPRLARLDGAPPTATPGDDTGRPGASATGRLAVKSRCGCGTATGSGASALLVLLLAAVWRRR